MSSKSKVADSSSATVVIFCIIEDHQYLHFGISECKMLFKQLADINTLWTLSYMTDMSLCVGIEMLRQCQTMAWYRSSMCSLVKRLVFVKFCNRVIIHTHTHTHPFNGPFPGLPRWASTRKVKSIWILLKQETVSGSGISWDICKSAPCSRQITTLAPHHSVFYRPDALPAA